MMFPISDLPVELPIDDVRVYCSVEAGIHYEMPADLIFAVALNEGGQADSKVRNSNGTYDLGLMQFNTAYLKTLKKFGVNKEDVQKNDCYPFHLAGWRIKQHIEEDNSEDIFTKVSYYHSRTPVYNARYRERLIENIRKFPRELANKYFNLIIERLKALHSSNTNENE